MQYIYHNARNQFRMSSKKRKGYSIERILADHFVTLWHRSVIFLRLGSQKSNQSEELEDDPRKYKISIWEKRWKAASLFVLVMVYKYLKRKKFSSSLPTKQLRYHDFVSTPIAVLLAASKKQQVKKVLMNSSTIAYLLSSDTKEEIWRKSKLPLNNANFAHELLHSLSESGCLDISSLPEPLITRLAPLLLTATPFIYLVCLYYMMKRLQRGDDFDHTTIDDLDLNETVTFKDVAGVENQVELEEIVRYLSDPKPFQTIGATPPRGLLLHGPPGCGKTLLARAVAGEAKADYFISAKGSDFVEIYVGQGAKRIRELFRNARLEALKRYRHKTSRTFSLVEKIKERVTYGNTISSATPTKTLRAPCCVIFIDEIDALAKCRDGIGRNMRISVGNDEREQTLNCLLTEMDGFDSNSDVEDTSKVNVIVIGATNRISILDPAILRSGRFDRHIFIPSPNTKGRKEILSLHASKVRLDDAVDLNKIASITDGFTGADLRYVINEAALLACREGKQSVGQDHLEKSVERVKIPTK